MQFSDVDRLITLYERESERLVMSVCLTDSEFDAVRTILGGNAEDCMYDCYPLINDALLAVLNLFHGRIPEGNYDYFLESELAAGGSD